MAGGRRPEGVTQAAARLLQAAALVLAILLLNAPAAAQTSGSGRLPGGGGFAPNSINPLPRIPPARLDPITPDTPPTLEQLNPLMVYDFDPAVGINQPGFTLWTVDDRLRPDPAVQPYLRMEIRDMDYGAIHLVVYLKDAPGLHDLFFYLRYHQESLHPRQIEPGTAFGFPGDRLFIGKLDIPGVVAAGFTRVRPDENGPTKLEDGVVAEIVFEKRPFDYKPWELTRAPSGEANRPENVQVYADYAVKDAVTPATGDVVLYWEERLAGDYNNDGRVEMSDILPLGRRYGRLSTDGWEDAWDWMADGNRDGEVTYRDSWLIEENYGTLLSGYRIYRRRAGAPRAAEELLRHRTNPLLPMSVHRPVSAWDPIRRVPYRYYDRDLPRSGAPTRWTYRIVPYSAVVDSEGERSDIEFTISVTDTAVQIVDANLPQPSAGVPPVKYPREKPLGRNRPQT